MMIGISKVMIQVMMVVKVGGESKGVDSDDSDDDDGGVPSRRARGRCRPSHLLNVYLTRGGCCRNS